MTARQLCLFSCVYLVITVIVAVVTRATGRRIAGVLARAPSSMCWRWG